MQLPKLFLFLIILTINTPINARNFPIDVVQTKDDAFLKGQPKSVLTQEDSSNSLILSMDKYDENGVLISHMAGDTHPSPPFETEIKKGRFIETRYSPSPSSLAPAIRALKYDDKGRATALKDLSNLDNTNTSEVPYYQPSDTTIVRIVKYDNNEQIHTIYKNRDLYQTIKFEFNQDGKLTQQLCIEGECSVFNTITYSKNGILRTINEQYQQNYYYENDTLASIVTQYPRRPNMTNTTYFGDYLFDSCGNWTQRASFSEPPSRLLRERLNITLRKIDYHSPCTQVINTVSSHLTCPSIMTYRIGNIDKRFSLSKKQAMQIAQEAASIWNQQAQRVLLQYDEAGEIPIHFVYDQRLLEAVANNNGSRVANKQLETLAQQVMQKKQDFELKTQQQELEFNHLNQKQQNLKNDIEAYTLKVNGLKISPDEASKLNQMREQLESRRLELLEEQNKFNAKSQILAQERLAINEDIAELKSSVNIGKPSSSLLDRLSIKSRKTKEFHIGTYQAQGIKRWIDIYSISNEDILNASKQTLIHEFGHALGLQHSEDPLAIMYYKAANNSVDLSNADKNMLHQLCPINP